MDNTKKGIPGQQGFEKKQGEQQLPKKEIPVEQPRKDMPSEFEKDKDVRKGYGQDVGGGQFEKKE